MEELLLDDETGGAADDAEEINSLSGGSRNCWSVMVDGREMEGWGMNRGWRRWIVFRCYAGGGSGKMLVMPIAGHTERVVVVVMGDGCAGAGVTRCGGDAWQVGCRVGVVVKRIG